MWLVITFNFIHPIVKFGYYLLLTVTILQLVAIVLQTWIRYRLNKAHSRVGREETTTVGELPRLTIQLDLRVNNENARVIRSMKSLDYPSDKFSVQILVDDKDASTLSPLDNIPVEIIGRKSFKSENEFLHFATSSAKGELLVRFVCRYFF